MLSKSCDNEVPDVIGNPRKFNLFVFRDPQKTFILFDLFFLLSPPRGVHKPSSCPLARISRDFQICLLCAVCKAICSYLVFWRSNPFCTSRARVRVFVGRAARRGGLDRGQDAGFDSGSSS